MKPKPLPGRPQSEDTIVTVAFEVLAFVTGTHAQLEELHARSSEALLKLYDEAGPKLVSARGEMRALRAEEAMMIIPRKFHLQRNGRQICTTLHVSKLYLVEDVADVTCKLCLAASKI